jgi:hypothetical protein
VSLLWIFGLGSGSPAALPQLAARVTPRARLAASGHEIFGIVQSMAGDRLVVVKRTGDIVVVDASLAIAKDQFAEPSVGHAVVARGTYDALGALQADTLLHAKDNPDICLPDR